MPVIIFAKNSIVAVQLGSKYAFGSPQAVIADYVSSIGTSETKVVITNRKEGFR